MFSIMLLLCGCRPVSYHNEKLDDAISSAIYETIGDELYYLGKEEKEHADLYYEYLIRDLGEERYDVLYDIVVAVNETIKKENITDKIDIVVYHELPGGMGQCVELSNFSNFECTYPDYDGLERLVISGFGYSKCVYDQPSTYIQLPNIKYLSVSEEIQRKADEQEIDWYDYWPDLESVEVF